MKNTQEACRDLAQEARVLLDQMTREEKIHLIVGRGSFDTHPVERLGVPSIRMTDGPLGVRVCAAGVEGIDVEEDRHTTAFPSGSAMAATWNRELIHEAAAAMGRETRATGSDILLGPGVNIVRSPLCGRTFEYFGEDPYLAGELGVAYVEGLQSQGVGCSVKHFACNNYEVERRRMSSEVDERALREIYLYAFEKIVKEADPWTLMPAYNRIRGVFATDQEYLMNDIARDEWGFRGIFVSDWTAVHSLVDSIRAGCDLEMPGLQANDRAYRRPALVQDQLLEWGLEDEDIDVLAVRMIELALKCREGRAMAGADWKVATPEAAETSYRTAVESMVLLKNEDNVLPLQPDTLKTVALIGPNIDTENMSGGGSSTVLPPYYISPLKGLREALPDDCEILAVEGYEAASGDRPEDDPRWSKALEAAQRADAVVFCGGYSDAYESEGMDRPDLQLPGAQNALLERLLDIQENTVVVLHTGSSVAMPWADRARAIVLAHYPGMCGGRALADILTGAVNPSGKLSATFYRSIEDCSAWPIPTPATREVWYGDGLFVGYRHAEARGVDPLFPFGHGLSYTTFAYRDLELPEAIPAGEPLQVRFTVTNTGEAAGMEAAQVYVGDCECSLPRPVKELKGFEKIELAPGESKTVSVTIDPRDFCFYDPVQMDWVLEPGLFEISVGASSADIRLTRHCRVG